MTTSTKKRSSAPLPHEEACGLFLHAALGVARSGSGGCVGRHLASRAFAGVVRDQGASWACTTRLPAAGLASFLSPETFRDNERIPPWVRSPAFIESIRSLLLVLPQGVAPALLVALLAPAAPEAVLALLPPPRDEDEPRPQLPVGFLHLLAATDSAWALRLALARGRLVGGVSATLFGATPLDFSPPHLRHVRAALLRWGAPVTDAAVMTALPLDVEEEEEEDGDVAPPHGDWKHHVPLRMRKRAGTCVTSRATMPAPMSRGLTASAADRAILLSWARDPESGPICAVDEDPTCCVCLSSSRAMTGLVCGDVPQFNTPHTICTSCMARCYGPDTTLHTACGRLKCPMCSDVITRVCAAIRL